MSRGRLNQQHLGKRQEGDTDADPSTDHDFMSREQQ